MESLEKRVCKCCGRELPVSAFRTSRLGVMRTCEDCMRKLQAMGRNKRKLERKGADDLAKAKEMRLSDFKPRELMEELVRRGYEFTMKYVETHVINSKDIKL